jgi:hypothetical protein
MTTHNLGYRIRKTSTGWSWETLRRDGSVQNAGFAPSKAVAAAWIIRDLAQGASAAAA